MEIERLIEALRCCGIHLGDKNCGECPVCATEEIKCPELMTLAADKLAKLNDFEQNQCAKLLVKLSEKDRQLAAAVEDLGKHCQKCTHQLDNEVGCDCEGICDPTKWRVGKRSSFTPKVPPTWASQFERRFMAGEGTQ